MQPFELTDEDKRVILTKVTPINMNENMVSLIKC